MIGQFKKIIAHPLFSGSALMIAGSNFANGINYVYHLLMGRLLGPKSYGELSALFSLIGLLGVIAIALNIVIVKYVSSAKDSEVGKLINWFTGKVVFIAAILFTIIFLAAPFIAAFLKITNFSLIILVGMVAVFMLLTITNKGALQGILNFRGVVATMLMENSVKLVFGIGLVLLGFAVFGAMVALVLSVVMSWLLSHALLKNFYSKSNHFSPAVKPMVFYALPALLQSIAITSLHSTDLVLVKHFFTSGEAGIYAAVATLGKIIYFAVGPIGLVMFPLVAKRQSRGESYRGVFLLSIGGTLALSLLILIVFRFMPDFALGSLYGAAYLEGVKFLAFYGVFMTIFALDALLVHYYFSLGQTKIVILPLVGAVFQAVGIWNFHDSIFSVIMVSIITASWMLMGLIMYNLLKRYAGQS